MTSLPVLGLALALATSAEAQPFDDGVSAPGVVAPQQVERRPWTRRFGVHFGINVGLGGGQHVKGVLFGGELFAHLGPVVLGGIANTTGLGGENLTTLAFGLGLRLLTSNAETRGAFELIGLVGGHWYNDVGTHPLDETLGVQGNPGVDASLPFAGGRLTAGYEWGGLVGGFLGASVTVDRDLSSETITHSWTETRRSLLCWGESCTRTTNETETITLGQLNVTVTLLNLRLVYQ